jgi:hypothetical protein
MRCSPAALADSRNAGPSFSGVFSRVEIGHMWVIGPQAPARRPKEAVTEVGVGTLGARGFRRAPRKSPAFGLRGGSEVWAASARHSLHRASGPRAASRRWGVPRCNPRPAAGATMIVSWQYEGKVLTRVETRHSFLTHFPDWRNALSGSLPISSPARSGKGTGPRLWPSLPPIGVRHSEQQCCRGTRRKVGRKPMRNIIPALIDPSVFGLVAVPAWAFDTTIFWDQHERETPYQGVREAAPS